MILETALLINEYLHIIHCDRNSGATERSPTVIFHRSSGSFSVLPIWAVSKTNSVKEPDRQVMCSLKMIVVNMHDGNLLQSQRMTLQHVESLCVDQEYPVVAGGPAL